jgi:hypothetical protein
MGEHPNPKVVMTNGFRTTDYQTQNLVLRMLTLAEPRSAFRPFASNASELSTQD